MLIGVVTPAITGIAALHVIMLVMHVFSISFI